MHDPELLRRVYTGIRNGWKQKYIAAKAGCTANMVSHLARIRPTRILPFGDFHCGSEVGLTPPVYQYKCIDNPVSTEHCKRNKWAQLQKECYDWYLDTLDLLRPINKVLVLGDCTDGDGKRSGGTEQITTDRKKQASMAIEVIEQVGCCDISMVYGTAYHTGNAEDFEVDIATHFNAKIGSHEWESVNGVVFDIKHDQSSTKNPGTSLFNAVVDNREWAVLGEQPKADVLIRAHTHRYCVLNLEDCLAISIPSLQAYGTKFGARKCSRKVQFGLMVLDVWPDGVVIQHVHIAKLAGHKTHVNNRRGTNDY